MSVWTSKVERAEMLAALSLEAGLLRLQRRASFAGLRPENRASLNRWLASLDVEGALKEFEDALVEVFLEGDAQAEEEVLRAG